MGHDQTRSLSYLQIVLIATLELLNRPNYTRKWLEVEPHSNFFLSCSHWYIAKLYAQADILLYHVLLLNIHTIYLRLVAIEILVALIWYGIMSLFIRARK